MSKGFDYSKWDNIELSDDESDCHPNIEKESWFRMKHRSRVEREEKEEADKKQIKEKMKSDDLRYKELELVLKRIAAGEGTEDDELEDVDGMKHEAEQILSRKAELQAKLDNYEKHKKWNVDNLSHVVEEKTIINSANPNKEFNSDGYALPAESEVVTTTHQKEKTSAPAPNANANANANAKANTPPPAPPSATSTSSTKKSDASASVAVTEPKAGPAPVGPVSESQAAYSYSDFVSKYESLLEKFETMEGMETIKNFLIVNGSVMLQEHASSYLLLACLEFEMNGERKKMERCARNSQVLTNITELAKSLKKHPGNVIQPFFYRVAEDQYEKGFQEGVDIFVARIIKRAVEKKKEMEAEEQETEEVDLSSLPVEDRLGPGGLDPVEVFESLPKVLQEAFESRDIPALRKALESIPPAEAAMHMKRCEDSGLWNAA